MVGDCHPFSVPIAKLRAESLPAEDQELASQPSNRVEFCCFVCEDFLTKPVSCGRCPVRFCWCCVEKLPKISIFHVCLGCGNHFTVGKLDHPLAWRMCTSSLPCRYVNCRVSLPPAQVTKHEVTCAAARVHCRFRNFGCKWTGARSDIKQHEAIDCILSKVEHGLEQFRLEVQNQRAKSDGSTLSEKSRLSLVQEFLSLRDSFRVQQAKQALMPQASTKGVKSRPINDSLSTQLIKRFKDESTTWWAQRSLLLQAIISLQEVHSSPRQRRVKRADHKTTITPLSTLTNKTED